MKIIFNRDSSKAPLISSCAFLRHTVLICDCVFTNKQTNKQTNARCPHCYIATPGPDCSTCERRHQVASGTSSSRTIMAGGGPLRPSDALQQTCTAHFPAAFFSIFTNDIGTTVVKLAAVRLHLEQETELRCPSSFLGSNESRRSAVLIDGVFLSHNV
jgi:hypothetical protein